jgi:gingipain R
MLIISPSEYFNDLAPFIDWKKQSGREVVLVDIEEIGNNQNSIYNYVWTYYQQNTDFLYLLIVGDHDKVACYDAGPTGGWDSETKWSDAKYSLVSNSNDWYPDIYVGRFSPSNKTDLINIIQRNLEYEINPDTSDYYLNALGLGSNEGYGYGDDGEADWQHLRNIRTDLLNYGYHNVYEFYDGTQGGEDANGNPNSTLISSALNNGISLFNYTGHGDINTCSSGNYSSSHINSSTNNGKYPFVVSVACNNGTFTSGTCISEVWQRASNLGSPTGAIAAAGSSILMSWAPPMASQDEIVDILVESYPNNKMNSIGALFYSGQMKMLDDYPNSGKEVIETWVLFGDPSTLFRSDIPSEIVVEHSETEEIGLTSTTIICNIENAPVTLWNGDSLIGKSNVLNGKVDFNFDSINCIDTLSIAINAYNKIPYFGQLRVINSLEDFTGSSEDLIFGPNPMNSSGQLTLIFELLEDQETYFELFNPLGQLIFSKSMLLNSGFYGPNYIPIELDLSDLRLRSGVYTLSTNINSNKTVKQLLVP